ncbi:hypothetical protein PG995_006091 [Apiospora arundinis]
MSTFAMSQNGNSETWEFSKFMEFVPELRQMIWRKAILAAYKDRTLILRDPTAPSAYHPDDVVDEYDEESPEMKRRRKMRLQRQPIILGPELKPSVLFWVNKESRKEAQMVYNVRLPIHGPGVPGPANGPFASSAGDGEPQVYISFVHDTFVTLDDEEAFSLNPERELLEEVWASVCTTARLSPTQTVQIERMLVIHYLLWVNDEQDWLDDPAFDFDLSSYSLPYNGTCAVAGLEMEVDAVAEECGDSVSDEAFSGVISRDDFFLSDFNYRPARLRAILALPIAQLVEQCSDQLRRTIVDGIPQRVSDEESMDMEENEYQ